MTNDQTHISNQADSHSNSKQNVIVASATHLFCDLKDHFSGKIRDDLSGHGKIRDDFSGHFTSVLSLSVKGDLSIDHMGLSFT